jgi:hypothetical protein
VVFFTGQTCSSQYGAFLRETGVPVMEKTVSLSQLRAMAVRIVGEG